MNLVWIACAVTDWIQTCVACAAWEERSMTIEGARASRVRGALYGLLLVECKHGQNWQEPLHERQDSCGT